MNILSHNVMRIALTAALIAPLSVFAAEKSADDHASHHPEQTQTKNAPASKMQDHSMKMQARMEAMQARMKAMEKTSDPKARMPMMQAQMEDMQAMMKDMGSSDCPMAGGKGGMAGMGMMRDQGGEGSEHSAGMDRMMQNQSGSAAMPMEK